MGSVGADSGNRVVYLREDPISCRGGGRSGLRKCESGGRSTQWTRYHVAQVLGSINALITNYVSDPITLVICVQLQILMLVDGENGFCYRVKFSHNWFSRTESR